MSNDPNRQPGERSLRPDEFLCIRRAMTQALHLTASTITFQRRRQDLICRCDEVASEICKAVLGNRVVIPTAELWEAAIRVCAEQLGMLPDSGYVLLTPIQKPQPQPPIGDHP